MAVLASICSDYASSGRRDFSKAWKMIRGLYTSDIHFTTSPKVSQNPNNSETLRQLIPKATNIPSSSSLVFDALESFGREAA